MGNSKLTSLVKRLREPDIECPSDADLLAAASLIEAGERLAEAATVEFAGVIDSIRLERCPICDWPLRDEVKDGCTIGNCSYRPEQPSEVARVRQRRQVAEVVTRLAAWNAAVAKLEEGER